MLFTAYLVALLPLASATWGNKPKPVCGTVTSTCYKTTTVPGPNPTTVTCTKGDWCYTTVTRTVDQVDCKYTTVTSVSDFGFGRFRLCLWQLLLSLFQPR